MAINLKPVDVAVVGLGAAGGVAVLPLARAGLKVAGIEAGTWMDPSKDFKPDEIHNNVRGLVTTVPKAKKEIPTFRTSPDAKARQAAAHPMMNAVGGTSIHYHAQSWRLKPWDFKTRSETIKRYGASLLPKGSTLEDWPVSYDELEPYYDTVEHEVGVSGKAGNIQGKLDPAGNVYEGPRQREYPMPPLRTCDFLDHMHKAARSLGWKPFHAPSAINSQPYHGRAACAYHGYCDRGGCHVRAKNSTCFTTIPEAQKTKNLTVFDGAQVTRIVADNNGKVTGVLLHSRRQGIFSARESRPGLFLHLRKYAPAAALEIESVSERPLEQSRPGGQALLRTLGRAGRRGRHGVVSDGRQHLVRRDAFARRGGGRMGRRYFRSFRARLHRRRESVRLHGEASHRGRQHGYVRARARVGFQMETVRARKRRPFYRRLSADQ